MGASGSKISLVENGRTIIDIGVKDNDGKIKTVLPADSLLPVSRSTNVELLHGWFKGL